MKFTQTGGKIQIKTCYNELEKTLIVQVLDNGAGIAEQDFPKLFTRFGKLKRTAELNHEGIGLGLTIVKQIIELSGGRIAVHSDGINKGSIFYFTMIMDSVQEEDNNNERVQ